MTDPDLQKKYPDLRKSTDPMNNIPIKTKGKLLYEDLSFKLNGLAFETHKELGRFAREKQYCDLYETKLIKTGLTRLAPSSSPPEADATGGQTL